MNTENLNNQKKNLAEALILTNRIEETIKKNESLGRSLLAFQNEFDNREIVEPVDSTENINFSGKLIEMVLKNTREILEMNQAIRSKLVLFADECKS